MYIYSYFAFLGGQPKPGQKVIVHYVGTLTNGNKFDSSRDRNKEFKFTLGKGEVIKGATIFTKQIDLDLYFMISGWDEGVATMKIGEVAKLTCTPDYAYGVRGYPPVYPFIYQS
ncbi:hypothetical protein KUTeg_002746 [Tegillarca granosa]|uniref:peptidylprolyl isomerase n=1 Tax=Tegillarca granosa TaxID=220873 RepID=A0ABQ9FR22_TEGGR|nr:hypothetical protein KUTeg_021557 [Tegillarca granosa]KAJ8319703.1 hypothetical protein KUTeg_002746 [Tegillarca granosa]